MCSGGFRFGLGERCLVDVGLATLVASILGLRFRGADSGVDVIGSLLCIFGLDVRSRLPVARV